MTKEALITEYDFCDIAAAIEPSRLRRALQVRTGRDIPMRTLNRILSGKAKNVPEDVLKEIFDTINTMPKGGIVNERRAHPRTLVLSDEMRTRVVNSLGVSCQTRSIRL